MMFWTGRRRAVAIAAALFSIGSLMAFPAAGHADGDKGKKDNKGGQTIVIGAPKIVPDQPPSNPPPKKQKKGG